jgi:GNAT superfamily N-acetyltransferase
MPKSMNDNDPTVDFLLDPLLDDKLKEGLVELWADVINNGGAVGLVPPVTPDDVREIAEVAFRRVEIAEDHLVIALIADEPVGMVFLEQRPGPLFRHWAMIKRLQVHPSLQGKGIGKKLIDATHHLARGIGLERLFVTVRGGTGRESFYERHGYKLVARIPGVSRVGPGDDRDELHLMAGL